MNLIEATVRIGAWVVKIEIMTARPTDQPTDGYDGSQGSFTSNKNRYGVISPLDELNSDFILIF